MLRKTEIDGLLARPPRLYEQFQAIESACAAAGLELVQWPFDYEQSRLVDRQGHDTVRLGKELSAAPSAAAERGC